MDGDWIQAGVAFVAVAAVAGWGLRPVGDGLLRRWERRFCLAVPDELRAEAAGTLRRRRAIRTLAVAAGLLVGTAPLYMNLIARHRAADVATPVTGRAWLLTAAVGALAAELWVNHRPGGPRRVALVRRRVADYVEPRWVATTVALAAVAIGVASADVRDGGPGDWWWAYAAGALVAVLATGHGLRTLRDRPMAAPEGPRRDLDEALRADGAHHIVGASVALAATSAAGAVSLAFESVPAVGMAAYVLSTATLGLWWTMVRDVHWSVTARRRLTAA